MTSQQVFNRVVKWLRRDDARRCVDLNGHCVYWREDGNRCAIGGVMTLKQAKRHKHATSTAGHLLPTDPELKQRFAGISRTLLDSLQGVHDSSYNWARDGRGHFIGEQDLRRIAERNDLKYEPVS